MADVIPTLTIISSYGGQKFALYTATVTAADVLTFATLNVEDIKTLTMHTTTAGTNVLGVIGGTDDNEVTVGSGPNAELVNGIIIYRSY